MGRGTMELVSSVMASFISGGLMRYSDGCGRVAVNCVGNVYSVTGTVGRILGSGWGSGGKVNYTRVGPEFPFNEFEVVMRYLFRRSNAFGGTFGGCKVRTCSCSVRGRFNRASCIASLFGRVRKKCGNRPDLFSRVGSSSLVLTFFPYAEFRTHIPLLFEKRTARRGK